MAANTSLASIDCQHNVNLCADEGKEVIGDVTLSKEVIAFMYLTPFSQMRNERHVRRSQRRCGVLFIRRGHSDSISYWSQSCTKSATSGAILRRSLGSLALISSGANSASCHTWMIAHGARLVYCDTDAALCRNCEPGRSFPRGVAPCSVSPDSTIARLCFVGEDERQGKRRTGWERPQKSKAQATVHGLLFFYSV